MHPSVYIVPMDLCRTFTDTPRESRPFLAAWGSTPIPGDPTKALVDVKWDDDPNGQSRFESLPGVLCLGYPWETLPAEAVPLLASFQHFDAAYAEAYLQDPASAVAVASAAAAARVDPTTAAIATIDGPEVAAGDSVARALLKIGRRNW